uniref:Uncharacterized protein n=1 Tax=Acrobeloides nanus TaxID=290746 RepID=A0A914DE49_9BILA
MPKSNKLYQPGDDDPNIQEVFKGIDQARFINAVKQIVNSAASDFEITYKDLPEELKVFADRELPVSEVDMDKELAVSNKRVILLKPISSLLAVCLLKWWENVRLYSAPLCIETASNRLRNAPSTTSWEYKLDLQGTFTR